MTGRPRAAAGLVVAFVLAGGLAVASCTGEVATTRADRRAPTVRPAAGSLEVTLARAAPDEPSVIGADDHGVVVLGRRGAAISYASDGRERWQLDPGDDAGNRFTAIALDADSVVAPVSDPPTGSGVLVLDRTTGATRWQRPLAAEPLAVGVGPGSTGAAIVAVLDRSGALTLLRAEDGTVVAQVALGLGHLLDDPRVWVRSGRVVVGWAHDDALEVLVLDGRTGEHRWSWRAPLLGAAPTVGPDQVIVVENTAIDGEVVHAAVRAFDLGSGAERWSTPVDGAFLPTAPVALAGDRALVVDLGGRLTALDARVGRITWQRATRLTQIEARPLLTRSVAAMATYGTGLVARSARTGAPVRNEIPGPVQTAVTIEGAEVAGDAVVLLVRRPAGDAQVWWLTRS